MWRHSRRLRSVHEHEKARRVVGDPVDAALTLAAYDRGITRPLLLERRTLARELPFDATRKLMSLLYDEASGAHLYVKGAPEVVLERSDLAPDAVRDAGRCRGGLGVERPEGHRRGRARRSPTSFPRTTCSSRTSASSGS